MPDMNMELATLEREKQLVVEKYQKKVITLDEEIRDLETKVKNVEEIFKQALGARIADLDRREKELLDDQAKFVTEKNEFVAALKTFQVEKEAFERHTNIDLEKITLLRDEAASLMNDAQAQKGHIAEDISRNSAILDAVRKERQDLEGAKNNYADENARIDEDVNVASADRAKAESLALEAQRMMNDAQASKDSISQQRIDLNERKKEIEALMKECDDAVIFIAQKKGEVDALIKESDDKIRQITLEREKNTNSAVANRAKEIALNEKERILNERERNIKIIQDQLTKGGV